MHKWSKKRGNKLDRFVVWRLVKHSRRAAKKIRGRVKRLRNR